MGVRFPTVSTTTFIGPLPANANETIVLTTPGLTLPLDNAQVILLWRAVLVSGVGTNAFIWRIRRGTSLTGALVMASSDVMAVGSNATQSSSGFYVDTPGAVGGQQYTLTISENGATAAGTWNDGCLMAFVL